MCLQIQFWRTEDGPESMREVDYILNAVKQYPRPRMKRQAPDYFDDYETEEEEDDPWAVSVGRFGRAELQWIQSSVERGATQS